ncbi:MAG: hypothetical protein ACPHRO_00040 [Nannocystaceae bacterium]
MAGSKGVDLDELMARLTALAEAQRPADGADVPEGEGGNFDCVGCEGCRRCRFCAACRDCDDCTYCEECVECVSCTHGVRSVECSDSSHLRDCRGCEDSRYLALCVDCVSCTYCLGCIGLEGKEFHVLNEPVSRSQYFKLAKAVSLEIEVRTHLGWRPSLIGLEPGDPDTGWSEEEPLRADETSTPTATAERTDAIEPSPVSRANVAKDVPSRRDATTDHHENERSFTGFEDPPAPVTRGRGSGWISAIADAVSDEDDADPITDTAPPEVTHTRLIESTGSEHTGDTQESRAPERLSLDALDEEGGSEDPSAMAQSRSSQRLGDAVNRSLRARGERRRSPRGKGGLDPLGALGTSADGGRAEPLRGEDAEGVGDEERESSGAPFTSKRVPSLFDSSEGPSSSRRPSSASDGDRGRGSLRRGRRPVRQRPPSEDDGSSED